MKKDVVFITFLLDSNYEMSTHLNDYMEFSIKTWEWWCKKNDIILHVFTKSDIPIKEMGPCWQRWYVYDILKQNNVDYRRVAIIDADTMIRWDSPNFFEFARDSYCGARFGECDNWVYKSIKHFKPYFPDTDVDWEIYIDNGMVLLAENSEDFTKSITDFYWENQKQLIYDEENEYVGTDQTPVNYLATKYYGDKIKHLSRKYNMMHMHLREVLESFCFLDSGWIWHFNGFNNSDRKKAMEDTWNKIKKYYK